MTNLGIIYPFNNGSWIWDDYQNSLLFISKDVGMRTLSMIKETMMKESVALNDKNLNEFTIHFREISDKLDKIVFKRYFQRHVKVGDPDVITIQDLKDIALYQANPQDLAVDFIRFVHTKTVDKFFRALIAYFHHFLNIWEWMLVRREERGRKLRQPVVKELEDVKMNDLSDLRAMVAREYLAVISGVGDAKHFHHMTGYSSLSDRDQRLYEKLMCLSVRIVWIALQRKHLPLIELEMNRMFRSDSFNLVTHRRNVNSTKRSPAEDRVLIGMANRFERTLLQRSPVVKELIFAEQDHRLLGAGVKVFQPRDDRIDYIEAAYSAPEELLNEMGIALGLLGIPREEFDPVLISRERTSKTYTKKITEIPDFKLPPKSFHSYEELPNTFPKRPCRFKETEQSVKCRKTQCKMWVRHVRNTQLGLTETSSDKVRQESSSRISVNDTKGEDEELYLGGEK